MKKAIKIIIIVIAAAALLFAAYKIYMLTGPKGEATGETWDKEAGFDTSAISTITMRDGEDFKILLFSDIQLNLNPFANAKAVKLVDELVGDISPDLIMTAGDNSSSLFSDFGAKRVIAQMESYEIPWGVVLGNHDSEGRGDRAYFGNLYEQADYSLFRAGPDNLQGIGNYVINIEDAEGNIIYALIMLDSNVTRKYEDGKDYDYIYPEQIEWYEQAVLAQPGVPSMLIFHIPLPEYLDAQLAYESGEIDESLGFGSNDEDVFSAPVNTGMFDKVLELKSTTHIFTGHDHINNLSVQYMGVWLTYGLKTGPASYQDNEKQGATLITLTSDGEVTVEHIYR